MQSLHVDNDSRTQERQTLVEGEKPKRGTWGFPAWAQHSEQRDNPLLCT